MPSAFHGTRLQSYLTLLNCDSVIVTCTTTSGCVRASVIDAFSQNFRVIVAEEGCFDRCQASHAINLCDMNAKYADVISTTEVINYLNALPDELFDCRRELRIPSRGNRAGRLKRNRGARFWPTPQTRSGKPAAP
jgi:hypothetical protein